MWNTPHDAENLLYNGIITRKSDVSERGWALKGLTDLKKIKI